MQRDDKRSGSDDTLWSQRRVSKILLLEEDNNRPVARVALRGGRFLVTVLVGAGAVIAILAAILLHGLTIEHGVEDANARVSFYQTINGFVWAGIAMLLEQYFRVFLAVMVIFLANRKWHPRDTPHNGNLPTYKRVVLLAFPPLVMFVVNVGLTSVFIEHVVTDVRHVFVVQDLHFAGNATLDTVNVQASSSEQVLTRDTILRGVVLGDVAPFTFNESANCSRTSESISEERSSADTTAAPSMLDIDRTSVTYAFPTRDWYEDILPASLKPEHTDTFVARDAVGDRDKAEEARFRAFLSNAGIELTTIHELLVQGLTSIGRAASISHASSQYPCDIAAYNEDTIDLSSFDVFQSGSKYAGRKRCYGFAGIKRKHFGHPNASTPDLQTLMKRANFAPFPDWNDMTLRIDTIVVSSQLNVTSLTIDLPYPNETNYRRDVNESECDGNGSFTPDSLEQEKQSAYSPAEWEQYQAEHCDPHYISNVNASQRCGGANCIFEDRSGYPEIKKQLTVAPYMKHCDAADNVYDFDLNAWFPNGCEPQNDAVLLYGSGSYLTGEFYANRTSLRFPDMPPAPAIANARRHYVFSFAKMEWRFEDVSKRFGAKCRAKGGCDGLLLGTKRPPRASADESTTDPSKVLVVGRDHVKSVMSNHSLQNPLVLLSLNAPKFYYDTNESTGPIYYFWERVDLQWMTTTYNESQGLGFQAKNPCSLVIDAYLQQQNANRYYIKDPLHPLYASAMFYLFQDANVIPMLGTLNLSAQVIGSARMEGDVETVEIRYSISLVSAVATSLGVVALLLYLAMMLQWPRDAVKLSDEQHFPAQYADVLMDDRYPQSVHARQLKLPNDDVVEMDDYVVDSIAFHHPVEPDQRVVM